MKQLIAANQKLVGCRQTKTREAVLEVFAEAEGALTAPEIKERLASHQIDVNKTTVYRELTFLMTKDIIAELVLDDGLKRYELCTEEHSHHLVCLSCRKIKRIPFADDLEIKEKQISHRLDFKILKHSLEFYGLCRHCRQEDKAVKARTV